MALLLQGPAPWGRTPVVAHLDRTVFVQPLAHGGLKQLTNFRFGMGASGSVVGKVKADCIAHAMISQRPIEVVARHDFCPE
jgi:hypothetical protein